MPNRGYEGRRQGSYSRLSRTNARRIATIRPEITSLRHLNYCATQRRAVFGHFARALAYLCVLIDFDS